MLKYLLTGRQPQLNPSVINQIVVQLPSHRFSIYGAMGG